MGVGIRFISFDCCFDFCAIINLLCLSWLFRWCIIYVCCISYFLIWCCL